MVPPIDDLTAQGYDLQFGTNTLGIMISVETSSKVSNTE